MQKLLIIMLKNANVFVFCWRCNNFEINACLKIAIYHLPFSNSSAVLLKYLNVKLEYKMHFMHIVEILEFYFHSFSAKIPWNTFSITLLEINLTEYFAFPTLCHPNSQLTKKYYTVNKNGNDDFNFELMLCNFSSNH